MAQEFDLLRLVDVTGLNFRRGRITSEGPQGDFAHASATLSRHRSRRLRGVTQARLAEVRRVRETGRVAHDDPYPSTSVAPRSQLFHPTLIEQHGGRRAIFDKDLGEYSATT